MRKGTIAVVSAAISIFICGNIFYNFFTIPPSDRDALLRYTFSAAGLCILLIPFIGSSIYRLFINIFSCKAEDLQEKKNLYDSLSPVTLTRLLAAFSENGPLSDEDIAEAQDFLENLEESQKQRQLEEP